MNELTITGNNPVANIKASTDVAGACKEIVERSAIKIQGRKYVPVEGWMAIATAHGCNLSASDVRQIDGGISARGIVRRISDGLVIGEAEGFVGDDEKTWANRPLYARRAMAQTRAMSRAARSVFAHVVVLMDAGLSTTPAEEMDTHHEEKEINSTSFIPTQPVKQKVTYEKAFMERLDNYFSSASMKLAHGACEKLFELIEKEKKEINIEVCKDFIELKLEYIKQQKMNYSEENWQYLYFIAKLFQLNNEKYFKDQWDLERHSRG